MTLLPFTTYGEAAERMVQHNPLALKRLAFVTSEDPDVIRAAQSLVTFGVQGAPNRTTCTCIFDQCCTT